jgi:uncharacterized phage protein (TIGR01671 family)
MRKIKFRAWHNEDEHMINSDRGVYTALQHCMNVTIGSGFSSCDTSPKKYRYTLMQFTGLYDSKGIEIFEGDILEICNTTSKNNIRYKVDFSEGEFRLLHKHGIWGRISQIEIAKMKFDVEFLVIGNMYENPELVDM